MIKKLALVLAAATGALAVQAAVPQGQAKAYMERQAANPMRYARQLKSASALDVMAMAQTRGKKIAPSQQIPAVDLYSFLEGPKGELWTCTYSFDTEEIQHEYYTETRYNGVTVTVYNSNLEPIGQVIDHYPLGEGQTGLAQIMIDPVLTQKFFNFDTSYELAIMVSYNTPDYSIQNKTYIYSVGAEVDAAGNTPRLAEYDGYIVASVDGAQDKWSEEYYITFLTESGYDMNADTYEEFVASQKYIAKTYKKASWGNGPEIIGQVEISVANLPGDMMSCPFQLSTVIDGKPTFIVQQYEKWFFNNVIGPTGDNENPNEGMPTEDNNLVIDVYTYPRIGTEWVLDHTTKVPCIQKDDVADVVFRYYGIGNLTYTDDYRPDGSLIMSIYKYRLSDDDNYLQTYALYDKDGNFKTTLAENASSFILMSDVPGQEPQAMFIDLNSDKLTQSEAAALLYFVNLESGDKVLEMTNVVDRFTLKANVDRVPYGNSYRYAFETNQLEIDEDFNVIENVLWLDAAGNIARVDRINLGERVALAQVYLDQSVLNPYLFDTDDNQEYLWLVKRYKTLTGSATDTELVLGSANGSTLLVLTPDKEKGELRTISVLKTNTPQPTLWIAYFNGTTNQFSQDFYSLPFNTLQGSGTEADPYKISTAGDLSQINRHLTSSFILTNDIDASQILFTTIPGEFTGKLDGAGHAINNLTISGNGSIFNSLSQGAVIKNLCINNVRIASTSGSTAGTLAGTASGAKVDNVHIMGLTADFSKDITFGGLIGSAYLYTAITNSSVSAANINATRSVYLGGICGDMRTASSVSSCSFAGAIHGGSYVGGIVGSMNSDNNISDCHVDADIVAMNNVGGIAGYLNSGLITRCYVEGSIEATGNPNANYDLGPAAGGILGHLKSESAALTATEVVYVVKDNLVALSSLKGYTPKVTDNTTASIHRIIGRTIFNEPADESTGAWGADPRMTNNFAVSTLPVANADVEAATNTTEGATVQNSDLNQDWFKNSLGFEYGDAAPWNESTDSDPALNHEQNNVCVPSELTVYENTKFLLRVIIGGREILTEQTAMEQFSFDCDEQYLAPTGVFSLSNNVLSVEFEAFKEGEVPVTLCGAKCTVTILKDLNSIETIVGDTAPSIALNGDELTAQGSFICVYNMQGIAVASGKDSVNVSHLVKGIYIAVANNTSLKFVIQ